MKGRFVQPNCGCKSPVPSTLFMNPPFPARRAILNEMPSLPQIHWPHLTGHHGAGQTRRCPHCGEKFAITADPKMAALAAVGAAVFGFFVLRPIPYVGIELWGAGAVAAVFIFAARLKKFGS
jgi:hypothetical protein